jgi:uncharacterized protein (TIGR03435 family)
VSADLSFVAPLRIGRLSTINEAPMNRFVFFVLCTIINVASLAAQQSAAPAFEVASVKPTQSTETVAFIRQNAKGRFVADNITVLNLIQQAYGVFGFQIVGDPSWLARERFDIQAITPSTWSGRPDVLLQRLLEERFLLRVHREQRDGDTYALVVARADGQLGPNLRPFMGDCMPVAGGQSPCRMRNGPNFTDAVGMPFNILVGQVIGNVERIVVDKTGLTGRFEFSYKWATDLPADAGDGRVSFITALEEQLGLRLERTTGSVDVLVIDSVERPTPKLICPATCYDRSLEQVRPEPRAFGERAPHCVCKER